MQWTGKLIGGALGLVLGPIGAAIGAAIGHQYDVNVERGSGRAPGEQFFVSTFRVMGHVAKADGRVTEREIAAARSVMHSLRLDGGQVQAAITLFAEGKQSGFDLAQEITALRAACHSQPQILRIFVEIQLRFALAGSDMTGGARTLVVRTATLLGIAPQLFARMEAAMRGGERGAGGAVDHAARTVAAYRTLEVDASIANEELTRAYRRLMSRHHPDKLKANGLPDSMLEHAKQRTQAIREAYELLKAQRGIG
ncbi:MAG: co-chaperone DjlA [Steroidobacteraceae bacterium]